MIVTFCLELNTDDELRPQYEQTTSLIASLSQLSDHEKVVLFGKILEGLEMYTATTQSSNKIQISSEIE